MKTKLLSTLLGVLVSVFSFGQTAVDLPVSFDDSNVAYNLVDFGGNASNIVTDPTGGTNLVVQINKSNTAALWAGTTIGGTAGFANSIPFVSGTTRISMRVYSPDAGIQVRLKAEDPTNPTISVETEATTTTANAWETLEFNFANQANGTAAINYNNNYQKLSMFFNFGVDGATAGAKTYYADDIEFLPAVILPITITFQVQNPDSTPVFIFGSWSGWSNWPGTLMTSVGNNTYTADITLTPASNYEYLFVNGGTTPTKEVLNPTDPCTNGNTQYTNRVINTGSTDTTICSIWNTCNSCGVVVTTQVDLPITFDDATTNYALVDFGGNASTIEPDPSGGSNNVCKVVKSNTAQLWAGTTVGGPVGLANAIPFSANATKISMRVFSPDAGIQIRMKAEDPTNAGISVETEATTTTSNAWETLVFDFANQANGTAVINYNNVYQMISVFFNFGIDGTTAGTKTYYFDDVQFTVKQIDLPVTFEDTTTNYALVDFGGNASNIETDPAGGSNNVCKIVKSNSAQLWAGTTVGGPAGLATKIPFAANSTKISMRVFSPDAGIQVRMKAEDPANPTISVETEATTTTSNAWETLEFNFANQANGTAAINFANVYQMISVFFNFGIPGASVGTKTYYFDDIQMMPPGPSTINVSFQVQNPDSTPVYLFGSWSGWSNWPGDLMSSVGNGTYSATIPLNASTNYEYLFVNGSTPTKEALNPNDPCTNGNTQYTNRVINTGVTDTTLCSIWNTCNSCNVVVTVPVDLPVTFEDINTVYGLTDFGGNSSTIVADPTGASNTVARVEKTNTAQTWAGTTIGGSIGFYHVIPFASGATKIRMRVYSPDSGIQIRMKTEDPSNPTISVETEATTTTANAWETLEFNFANQANGTAAINFANVYQKLSVFFNFGIDGATAGTKIYYFDDVEFGGNPPAAVNYTFRVQNPDSVPVFVFGSWSGWSNWPGTLMTSIGNNMYEATISLTENNSYEFLYVNGGTTPTKELLDPSWPCTNGNSQYTNRILTTGTSDSTICSIWATCSVCSTVGVNELSNADVKVVMQNDGVRILSSEFNHADELEIMDVLGRTIYSTTGNVPVNSFIPVNFGSGSVYLIKLKVNGATAIYKGFAGN